jgi:fatty-acyl-CoA synthase
MPEWYPKKRYGDLPRLAADRFGDRTGLVFKGQEFSFTDIAEQVDLTARALLAIGVKAGDHVSLWLNNQAEWIFLQYGLAKIGAVMVPINTRFRTRDLKYVLWQSDSAFLITHDTSGPIDYLDMVRQTVSLPTGTTEISDDNFPELRRVIILGEDAHDGTISWNEATKLADTVSEATLEACAAAVDPDDVGFIMYTSGTTGFPKGVMHSHILIRNVEERGFLKRITTRDTILNYLPLFHAFGFSEGSMMSLITGARQILTETFDADESLDIVEREGVTILHGFEAHIKALVEAQEAQPRNLSSLRTGIFAAGPHSATPIIRKAQKVLAPIKSLTGFGMTETWPGIAISSLDDDEFHRCETSGYPALGYEIRIVDPETGAPAKPNVEGELEIRGHSVMLGYYKKPEETKAVLAEDGWLKTGDMAMWLDDGYFRFLGRYKDMLKVGGENVDPMETEGLLREHPDVHEVAIVGLPDDKLSEVPVAFIQRASGTVLTASEVLAYCRGKVASFKVPRHVIFVDEFPMTASGKIRKVDLRTTAKQKLTT